MPRMTDPNSPRTAAPTNLTAHARARCQQRGIPEAVVDLLFAHGRSLHDHRGCEVLYFDKGARQRLGRERMRLLRSGLDRLLNTYLVVGADGAVVTAGRRFRRLRRDP